MRSEALDIFWYMVTIKTKTVNTIQNIPNFD